MDDLPHVKRWCSPRLITEHAFDKLRQLDLTFAEFELALDHAEIIEQQELGNQTATEIVLLLDWARPLHVVVFVDEVHDEDRVVTVCEPDRSRWSADDRRRR